MLKDLLKRNPGAEKFAGLLEFLPWAARNRQILLEMLPKNSVCAEVGVHRGDFSARVLKVVNPKEFHLIDPWRYEESNTYKAALYGGKARGGQAEMDERCESVQRRFDPEIRSGRVVIHRDNSNTILGKFPDGYFDWIYIDGNHLYEFVRQDLALSFQKTKPGGYLTGDDYQAEGWWEGGVKKAVDEFVRSKSVQLASTDDGQFVLRKELA